MKRSKMKKDRLLIEALHRSKGKGLPQNITLEIMRKVNQEAIRQEKRRSRLLNGLLVVAMLVFFAVFYLLFPIVSSFSILIKSLQTSFLSFPEFEDGWFLFFCLLFFTTILLFGCFSSWIEKRLFRKNKKPITFYL